MVVRAEKHNNKIFRSKTARTLAAAAIASSSVSAGLIGPALNSTVHAESGITEVIHMWVGESTGISISEAESFDIRTSSEGIGAFYDPDLGHINLTAQRAGTYTVYAYDEINDLMHQIKVVANTVRNATDTNGDGLIDISEVVAYIKLIQDLKHDEEFEHEELLYMLSWINFLNEEANRAPYFSGEQDKFHYLLPEHLLDSFEDYVNYMVEPDPNDNSIFLRDYFDDPDYNDFLSFEILAMSHNSTIDAGIIIDTLQFGMKDSAPLEPTVTTMEIRAHDDRGASFDKELYFELNLPPVLSQTEIFVEVDEENNALIDLNDYLSDPNDDLLTAVEIIPSGGDIEDFEQNGLTISFKLNSNDIDFMLDISDGFYITYLNLTIRKADDGLGI